MHVLSSHWLLLGVCTRLKVLPQLLRSFSEKVPSVSGLQLRLQRWNAEALLLLLLLLQPVLLL